MAPQCPVWFQFLNPAALHNAATTGYLPPLHYHPISLSHSCISNLGVFLRSKKTSVRPCAVCDVVLSMDFHEVWFTTGCKMPASVLFVKIGSVTVVRFWGRKWTSTVNCTFLQYFAHSYSILHIHTYFTLSYSTLQITTVLCTFVQYFTHSYSTLHISTVLFAFLHYLHIPIVLCLFVEYCAHSYSTLHISRILCTFQQYFAHSYITFHIPTLLGTFPLYFAHFYSELHIPTILCTFLHYFAHYYSILYIRTVLCTFLQCFAHF